MALAEAASTTTNSNNGNDENQAPQKQQQQPARPAQTNNSKLFGILGNRHLPAAGSGTSNGAHTCAYIQYNTMAVP